MNKHLLIKHREPVTGQTPTSEPMSFAGVPYRDEGPLAGMWVTQRQQSWQRPISAWVRAHSSWKLEVYYITDSSMGWRVCLFSGQLS